VSELLRERDLDCGNHSCRFARNKTGMRTNGPCTCVGNLIDANADLRATITQQAQELERLTNLHATTRKALADTSSAQEEMLRQQLAASQARCLEMEQELIKWQQPFDADMLKEVEHQASHGDSLAAQRIYITALEHGLKQLQATLAAREAELVDNQIEANQRVDAAVQELHELKGGRP